jgi:hypothetical protein
MNATATRRQLKAGTTNLLVNGKRAEMLQQYTQAIDHTIMSFQQAYDRAPQDERLVTAFARFRCGLNNQLIRLEALRPRLTDERELQTLDHTIKTVQSALSASAIADVQFCL